MIGTNLVPPKKDNTCGSSILQNLLCSAATPSPTIIPPNTHAKTSRSNNSHSDSPISPTLSLFLFYPQNNPHLWISFILTQFFSFSYYNIYMNMCILFLNFSQFLWIMWINPWITPYIRCFFIYILYLVALSTKSMPQ